MCLCHSIYTFLQSFSSILQKIFTKQTAETLDASKTTAKKYSPPTVITECYFILRDICFYEKYMKLHPLTESDY